jgi:hypothetical protein
MTPSDAMLRYATLRYATLRYATLRYATLRYATLRYATLRYAMSCGSQPANTDTSSQRELASQHVPLPVTSRASSLKKTSGQAPLTRELAPSRDSARSSWRRAAASLPSLNPRPGRRVNTLRRMSCGSQPAKISTSSPSELAFLHAPLPVNQGALVASAPTR